MSTLALLLTQRKVCEVCGEKLVARVQHYGIREVTVGWFPGLHSVSSGLRDCGTPDTDSDGDGVANCQDNCPTVANPDQKDGNGDGKGDACTEVCGNCRDDDGDGLVDLRDPDCPSSVLTIEKGVLALDPDPQEEKITLMIFDNRIR